MANLFGVSKNGIEVFAHPAGHPHREDLVEEALSLVELPTDNTFCLKTVDFGRVIGVNHLVETTENDTICYLRRGNRPGESRMVLNRKPEETSLVTVICCVCRKDKDTPDELVGKWVVVTLFEGTPGEKEPFDNAFTEKDIDDRAMIGYLKAEAFWRTHALVPTEQETKQIENGEDIYCGQFQFEFEVSNAYCMSAEKAIINGRWFDIYDFGSHEDFGWQHRTEEDGYGCVDGHFVPDGFNEDIAKKYHITEDEWDEICDTLQEECSWGHCGWCD
jgi:hypothetical protein